MASSSNGAGGTPDGTPDPWAWLGLLKWSLSYTDGTQPASEKNDIIPMSPEDREFLEKVMKEGIIDENERMKTVLQQVTAQMDVWRQEENSSNVEQTAQVEDLLEELRDIVEQIDYARAFAAMKGLSFLLGCIQQESIPVSIRSLCLRILSTLCQNNPPVQQELLELGSLKILSDLFFDDSADSKKLRPKLMQAMSANVRSHDLTEAVFCQLEQAADLLTLGLHQKDTATRQRTLFFLHALVTSDTSTYSRMHRFARPILTAVDDILLSDKNNNEEENHGCSNRSELVERTLLMVEQILEQKRSVNALLSRKDALAAKAVQRVAAIREMKKKEEDHGEVVSEEELHLWESVLQLLARAKPDEPPPPPEPTPPQADETRIEATKSGS